MKLRDISKQVLGTLFDSDNFLEAIRDQNIEAIRNLIEDEIHISADRQKFTGIVKADLVLLLWELGIDIHEAFPHNIIPDGYFKGAKVQKLKIPDYIEGLATHAFQGCEELEYLELPHHLKSMNAFVFRYCVRLKHITVPNTLIYVGSYSFEECQNIKDIKFLGTIKEWKAKQSDHDSCIPLDVHLGRGTIKVTCTDGVCDFDGKVVK